MARVTQAHIDQRREDIIHAAHVLFLQKGWQQTSMQEVAAAAGISTGAVYRYFEGKDDLLRAVFKRGADLVRAQLDGAEANTSVLETMYDLGVSVLDDPECGDPRMQLASALACADDPDGWGVHSRAMTQEILDMLEGLVTAAKATGEIGSDLDTAALARILYFVVPGVAALTMHMGEKPDTAAILQTTITLLRRSKEG